MPRFSTSLLHAQLASVLPPTVRTLSVAFSGGLDSTVLLHALAELRSADAWRPRSFELRAIHVDHQLQSASAQWREHCLSIAAALSIPCTTLSIDVQVRDEGIEAAARQARYSALRPLIKEHDALLTAHHADDQLESVMLALLRGSGVSGLAASPPSQPFGEGSLVRPLLSFTREELKAWAEERDARWIEDPSNERTDFDRNFLRAHVTPILKQRWPAAALSATRAAAHLAETSQLLEALADLDLQRASVGRCLDLIQLEQWPSARRRNALRLWLKRRGIRAPSTRKLAAIEHDIFAAQADRIPCIEIEHAVLRRHRNLLYCDPPFPALNITAFHWNTEQSLQLPAALGSLSLRATDTKMAGALSRAKLPSILTVRFRQGGERLRPGVLRATKELKKLLQEAAVLPWWRARLPLIYAGDRLVAVGDLWIDANFAATEGEPSCVVAWSDRPMIQAVSSRTV
jgi:tRNA(Ile)-lysidine synthase